MKTEPWTLETAYKPHSWEGASKRTADHDVEPVALRPFDHDDWSLVHLALDLIEFGYDRIVTSFLHSSYSCRLKNILLQWMSNFRKHRLLQIGV